MAMNDLLVPEPKRLEIFSNADIKMSVVDAMDELMREKPIDRLSVASICENAGISRATFYRYFTDKFSVVQWLLKYVMAQGANEIGRTLTFYDGYYTSEVLILERYYDFFANSAKSNDYNSLDQFSPRLRKEVFERTITKHYKLEYTEHMRFMVNATVEMETSLFPMWHYGEIDCTIEEACQWMVECVPRELFNLLNEPINPIRNPHTHLQNRL
ncbi:MAG: TetR/AcrR family transcriptional regulator [Eggerthellaceae bacterium]|nr:TetR/AcrR family transcriptional regulator [Eggerthellaceae bacterium]